MAQAEVEDGAKLLYRKAEDNTWGVLDASEDFAAKNPALVKRVLKVYEDARIWARSNQDALKKALVAETKLPDAVIARQLERTDLTNASLTPATTQTILEAGLALQKAGVIKADVDVKAATAALIDTSFAPAGK
jgi:sulfonate transport system substrate-binding protein